MKDLTSGNERKLILNFATPMLLGNIFQQLYNIVDSIIVGNFIGKEALAAVGASFPIIFALISFIIGIASGGTIVIAQYFGARDYDMVRKAVGTIYIFIFVSSLLLTIIGITFSDEIFQIIRLPAAVVPEAKIYLNTFLLGLVIFFGFNATSAILRGLGDSKTPLYFLIIATIFNVLFDLLFIVVFKWGIRGAALATVISQGGAFITAIIYLNKTHKIVKFNLGTFVFNKTIFLQSFRIGLPTGFQQTFVALGMMALFRIVNQFGTNVVAAYSVAGRIDHLATLPAMNFGQALSTFVGQNLGAKKMDRIKAGMVATLKMSALVSIIASAFIILFRYQLMGLFTNDKMVIEIGVQYLIIVGSFYIIFSTMFAFNGVLRGAGATLVPMFITLISLWVIRVPAAALLSGRMLNTFQQWGMSPELHPIFSGSMAETGIWWAVPLGWFLGLILSFLYFLSGKWKKKGVVREK